MYNHRAYIFGRCLYSQYNDNNNDESSPLLSLIAAINYLWLPVRPIKTGNYCDMLTSDAQIILSEELTNHNGELYANIRK